MANSTFPIKYNPSILSFNSLIAKEGMMFSSNGGYNAAGYNKTYYSPSPFTVNPVANVYSIEVDFDARTDSWKTGTNVPNSKTYLGTLRFNLLVNDESIFFE
jgi:hypothetical protein